MKISELTNSINIFFEKDMKQKCRILSIMPDDKNWIVTCEVMVDPDYTVRKGIGDIVEIYEVYLNCDMAVTGFKLKETKRKATVDNE
ncbi:MAG: hypothetical protein A2Y17_00825 [Clostridiales bacterium GWF2_38_85]|nr:MAG: hypothetical protein A2Y17_00825 [Clostridiales bacterium GWF2_38_85]